MQNLTSIDFSYTVCNINCIGFCDTAVVSIIFDLGIPSGITPNGDGVNDFFVIPHLNNEYNLFPENELVVFNRWGDVVFQSQPYHNDWTGESGSGEELPEGTYYYVFKLEAGVSYQGDLTILR